MTLSTFDVLVELWMSLGDVIQRKHASRGRTSLVKEIQTFIKLSIVGSNGKTPLSNGRTPFLNGNLSEYLALKY